MNKLPPTFMHISSFLGKTVCCILLCLPLSVCFSFAQNDIPKKQIAGKFVVYSSKDYFNSIAERIPELICSGILIRADFAYTSVNKINSANDVKRNSKSNAAYYNANALAEPLFLDELKTSGYDYFLSGSLTELNNKFSLTYTLTDCKSKQSKQYSSPKDLPIEDLYKQIDNAATFLKLAVNSFLSDITVMRIAMLDYDYNDAEVEKELGRKFPAEFISLNLNGANKFNIVYDDSIQYAYYNSKNTDAFLKNYNFDGIVKGYVSLDKEHDEYIINAQLYYMNKAKTIIDSVVCLPVKKNSYYAQDLPNELTENLQKVFNSSITDSSRWNPVLFDYKDKSLEELQKIFRAEQTKNLSFAYTLAFLMTQKQNGEWLGNYLLGEVELGRGNYDEAINFYRKSLSANQDSLQAKVGIGKAMSYKGYYPEALQYFREVEIKNTQIKGLHKEMALCYYFLRNDSIWEHTDLWLKYDHDSSDYYKLRGLYFSLDASKQDSAIRNLELAYRMKPDSLLGNYFNEVCFNAGTNAFNVRDFPNALMYYFKTFVADTTALNLDYIRYCYIEMNKNDSSNYYAEFGLKHGIYSSTVYLSQARYYVEIKKSEEVRTKNNLHEALNYLDLYTRKNNDLKTEELISIFSQKGIIYNDLAQIDSSVANFKSAIRLQKVPLLVDFLNLAEAEIMNNKPQDALTDLNLGLIKTNWKRDEVNDDPDIAIAYFLTIVAKTMLKTKYQDDQRDLDKILKRYKKLEDAEDKRFIKTWSYISFQKWLQKAPYSADVKNKINGYLKTMNEFSAEGQMLPVE